MHALETNSQIPGFLMKVWKIVEDERYDDLIVWNSNGTSFRILDQIRFSIELLPLYFKHNNMASFIRQLNMYGFRKVANIEQGALKSEGSEIEFQHQFFMRGQAHLLEYIKRKIPTMKPSATEGQVPREITVRTDLMERLVSEVGSMRTRQEAMDTKLGSMKKENELVWRELVGLRHKHEHQRKVVNNLIHFLMHLANQSTSTNISGMKRTLQLMINESLDGSIPSYTRQITSNDENNPTAYDVSSPSASTSTGQDTGPQIHDVTDNFKDNQPDIDENCILHIGELARDCLASQQMEPLAVVDDKGLNLTLDISEEISNDIPPLSPSAYINEKPGDCGTNSNSKSDGVDGTASTSTDRPTHKSDLTSHVDTVQLDLELLKEFLTLNNSNVKLDSSTLLGLFNPDENSSSQMNSLANLQGIERTGDELMEYNPSLFDLVDDMSYYTDSTLPADASTVDSDALSSLLGSLDASEPGSHSGVLNTPEAALPPSQSPVRTSGGTKRKGGEANTAPSKRTST